MKATVGVLALLGLFVPGDVCLPKAWAQGSAASVFLSKKEDSFFKYDIVSASFYMHFRTNGTYRRIDREHMGVEEVDRGTWTQDSKGSITLRSAMHYRNIEAGPLQIWTWEMDVAPQLPQLHATVTNFLRTNHAEHFDSNFVTQRLVLIRGEGTTLYCPIYVTEGTKEVSRRQLASLLRAVEEFRHRTDNNHLHLTAMKYRGVTFLVWKDAEMPLNPPLAEIKKSIDRLKKEGGKAQFLLEVFQPIDKRTFTDESEGTQDFLFVPYPFQTPKQGTEGQK
jgi:hypothetical protein